MAVQFVDWAAPSTENVAGVASEAPALGGVTVPISQARLTMTVAALLSEKSLWTVKVLTDVFTIVHSLSAEVLIGTLSQLLSSMV